MKSVLAISGSLRAASLNSALLRAAAQLAPPEMNIVIYTGLGDLPLFNPDIEASDPAPVADLRRRIVDADALIVAGPEYAHGITGVLKNALDWMVGNESFVDKPVALFNASPLSEHATPALREVVKTMSARVVDAASVTVAVRGYHRTTAGILADMTIAAALREALRTLHRYLNVG